MNRVLVWATALAVGLVMFLSLSHMPDADALPTTDQRSVSALKGRPELSLPCRYRGRQHVVQHANGNLEADSRYHVMRGEPPTCPTNGSGRDTDSTWQDRQRAIDRERHGLDWPY